MPIIAAIIGAVMTGLFYWFMFGGGMAYIDTRLRERDKRKQRAALPAKQEAAPLRSLQDPREAAVILMIAVALARGVPTPEQLDVVRDQMRDVLGFAADLSGHFAYCRFAAEQAPSPEGTIDDLADLLRRSLNRDERIELGSMLERVAALHGGPTERQERFVSLVLRRVTEAA